MTFPVIEELGPALGQSILMAGNAFLEQCGSTGLQAADDLIQRFGADTFRNVFTVKKKEIKAVRVCLRFAQPGGGRDTGSRPSLGPPAE